MNRSILVVPPDGPATVQTIDENDPAPMQKLVGGYFEVVPMALGTMFVNEDGLSLRLPLNPRASSLAYRPIVGTAVLAGPADGEGGFADVARSLVARLGGR